MTTDAKTNRPIEETHDVRTWLRECFLGFCVDPGDSKYQRGYLACALCLWDEMQLGHDEAKAKAEAMNGFNVGCTYH
jgi:hypothetical protein